MSAATVVVVMGVAGAGKSTVGVALAERLGWAFQEGDNLHPPENIARMAAGIPLTDADRGPWLDAIQAWIDARLSRGESGVITCSGLKRAYRMRIVAGRAGVRLVYLEGSQPRIAERLEARKGHFMPAALLASQFADLEPPEADEAAVVVDSAAPLGDQIDRIVRALGAGT